MLLTEYAAATDEIRQNAVLAWLRDHPGWLLILDNADTRQARAAVNRLRGDLHGGHVLLTSRLDDFDDGIPALRLDVLAEADAIAFLRERTEGRRRVPPTDETDARSLARDLDGLALALELAAATIRYRRCSFADYRALWQGSRRDVEGWNQPAITNYPSAVGQAWATSVALLTEDARVLLERLAFLAPDPVPESLLDDAAKEALLDLARYSLATRDVEFGHFAVHRLIQDATRRSLDEATARARLIEALEWVNDAFIGHPQDWRTWNVLDPLATHAEVLAWAADKARIADPTARLMSQLGLLFRTKAQHARAELLSRRALAITEASLGPDHPNVAIRLNNLAALLYTTNRLAEAELLFRRSLTVTEPSLGPDHPNVATSLNNLAELLRATNRLAEAEPLFRRALAIDETSLGPDHPNVATSLNNLAALLRATNRLAEAEPLYRRALVIGETSLGPDHPNVATDLNNLAALLYGINRLAEAEPLFRRVVTIFETSLGPDHPDVAIRLNNLADLLRTTNRLAEAEPLFRRALAITETSLGPDHPNVATGLNNLAVLLRATNRLAEAEPLMRRHLVIFLKFERATGHQHPNRDAAIGNYVDLLEAMGRSEVEINAAIVEPAREAGLDLSVT